MRFFLLILILFIEIASFSNGQINNTGRPPSELPTLDEYSYVGMQMLVSYYNQLSELFSVDLRREAILLQYPAVVLNGLAFDARSWASDRRYAAPSPQDAAFSLTDGVPAAATRFVPKNSISAQWSWLLRTYQWADPFWDNQMCQLLECSPSVEALMLAVRTLLSQYQALLDANDALWNACTRARPWQQCLLEQAVHDERAAVKWRQYEQAWRLLTHLRAKYNKLFWQQGDSVVANRSTLLRRSLRLDAADGSSPAAAQYLLTAFDPPFWWLWLVDSADPAFDTPFRDPVTRQDYRTPPDSLFRPLVLDSRALYFDDAGFVPPHPNWEALGGIDPAAVDVFAVFDQGRDVVVRLEAARVAIERGWLDLDFFSLLAPLAQRGVGVGGWSSGDLSRNNTGSFPLLTSSFIVGRRICFTAASWKPGFLDAVLSPSPDQPPQLALGPFVVRGDAHFFSRTPTAQAAVQPAEGDPNGFCITTPQIIAWTAGALPQFPSAEVDPNHDPFVCNRSFSAAQFSWNIPNVTDPDFNVSTEAPTTTTPATTTTPVPVWEEGYLPNPFLSHSNLIQMNPLRLFVYLFIFYLNLNLN